MDMEDMAAANSMHNARKEERETSQQSFSVELQGKQDLSWNGIEKYGPNVADMIAMEDTIRSGSCQQYTYAHCDYTRQKPHEAYN